MKPSTAANAKGERPPKFSNRMPPKKGPRTRAAPTASDLIPADSSANQQHLRVRKGCHESKFWKPGTLGIILEVDVHPNIISWGIMDIDINLFRFSPLFIPCHGCQGSVKNRPTATARFGPAGVASSEVGRNSWLRAKPDIIHACSANVNQEFQLFSKSAIQKPKKKVPDM